MEEVGQERLDMIEQYKTQSLIIDKKIGVKRIQVNIATKKLGLDKKGLLMSEAPLSKSSWKRNSLDSNKKQVD